MEVSEAVLLRTFARLARQAGVLPIPDVDKIHRDVKWGITFIEGIMRSELGESREYWADQEMQENYRGLLTIRNALDGYFKEREIVNARVMHTTPVVPLDEAGPVPPVAPASAEPGEAKPRPSPKPVQRKKRAKRK